MKKKILFALLSLCMICPFAININASQANANTIQIDQVSSVLNKTFLADSGGAGAGIKTHNINGYKVNSNGSFVLYLTHYNACTYYKNLASNYYIAKSGDSWVFIGTFLGAISGYYVSVAAAGLFPPTKLTAWGASTGATLLSSFATWFAQQTTGQKAKWMISVSKKVEDLCTNPLYSNAGIYITFTASTHTYHVGIQSW